MRTPTSFTQQLVETVTTLNKISVKETIGDSTANHRVLTVSQLIRYLSTRRNSHDRKFVLFVKEVYASVRSAILAEREANGLSTDYTIYVTEFVNFLETTSIAKNNAVRAAIKRVA